MKRATYDGLWWLPDQPDDTIAGQLQTYPAEPPTLALSGSFAGLDQMMHARKEYDAIFGVTQRKEVTLARALETGSSLSSPGFLSQNLIARVVFLGAHRPDAMTAPIGQAYIEYTLLPEWCGRKIGSEANPDPKLFLEPDLEVAATVPSAGVSLSYGWRISDPSFRDRTLSQTTRFKIEPESPANLDEVLQSWARPMGNLLSLATGVTNVITGLLIRFGDQDPKSLPVEVIFSVSQPEPIRRLPRRDEMLFTLQSLGAGAVSAIEAWFGTFAELRDVHNLYFGAFTATRYEEAKFLVLAQTIELYDRCREPNYVAPKQLFRSRVRAIVDSVSAEEQDWLRAQLQWSNEPRLKERLRRLLARSGPALDKLIPDPVAFVDFAGDTRNYYTHYDARLSKKAARGFALFQLNQKLRALIEALLLREAGLDWAAIAPMIERRFRIDGVAPV